jgi:hypothetical protein
MAVDRRVWRELQVGRTAVKEEVRYVADVSIRKLTNHIADANDVRNMQHVTQGSIVRTDTIDVCVITSSETELNKLVERIHSMVDAGTK